MGPIIKEIIAKDKDGTKFGLNFLPKMAAASRARGSIGTYACGASSFRERVNSYAYADGIVTKGSTLLGDDEIGMLAILRMNKKFMYMSFMRRHNPDLKNQLRIPSAHACHVFRLQDWECCLLVFGASGSQAAQQRDSGMRTQAC